MTEAGTDPLVTPGRVEQAEGAAQSYRRVESEILALPADQVGRITADVAHAASIALGALNNLQQLRPDFEALHDRGTAVAALDKLEHYAMAAFYTHLQMVPDSAEEDIRALLEQGKPIREKLLTVAEALVHFEIFRPNTVNAIREGTGYLDIAKDLVALGTLYSSNWHKVENNVPFGLEMVQQASFIGPRLLRAIGAKEVGEVRTDPTQEWSGLRERAFRLMVNAYEELRRATAYVRWHHGDAAAFTPSLHARKPRRQRSGAQSEPEFEDTLPTSDQLELGGVQPEADPGLPGANPFSS